MEKSPDAFRTISEAAEELDLPQHVLRFWETRFSTIKPLKRGGGRRYYRPDDIALAERIHHLLHVKGYTVDGARKALSSEPDGAAAIPRDVPVARASHSEAKGIPVAALVALRERLAAALR